MKRGGRLTSRASLDPGCGKRRYRSQLAAEKALARISGLPGADEREKTEQRAYECHCAFWHLTSQPPPTWTRAASTSSGTTTDTGFSRAVKLACRTRAGSGDPDEARCEACAIWLGRYGGQVQHRLARRSGGSSDPEVSSLPNAALLCGTPFTGDHGRAESRDREMGPDGAGFWLRSGQHPADEPILLAGIDGGIRVWLTAKGDYSTEAPVRAVSA